jgi:hypothetical protein
MSRRSSTHRSSPCRGILVLLMAWSLFALGCAKSNSGQQASAASSSAPMPVAASATSDLMVKLPVYPGAVLAASQTPTIAGKHVVSKVYTTRDSFDQVYKWYRAALPAQSETSHQEAQMESSAVFALSGGSTQQSVSIVKTGGVEVTNITLTVTGK